MRKILNTTNLIYFLLILFGTFTFFRAPADPDFGWHYKYGEYFIQHGKILRENIFSYTNIDYKWVNSYWVAESIMYLSHHFLGSVFSTLTLSFLLSVFLLILIKKQTKNTLNLTINYILLSTVLSLYTLTVRPFYYSTLFMFFLLYVLLFNKKWIKVLPFIFMVWANTHADFVIALFIFGFYCLNDWVKKTLQEKRPLTPVFLLSSFFKSFKFLFLSTIATLFNPYGINLWTTLARELTQPVKSFVQEWLPFNFNFNNPTSFFLSILLAMGLILGFLSYKRTKDQFDSWYVALIVLFYLLSIKACYFGRIFFILSSFSLIQEIGIQLESIGTYLKEKRIILSTKYIAILLTLVVTTTSSLFIENIGATSGISKWSVAEGYPYNAIIYVRNNPIIGNMWNLYGWGGYLIWQLPEYKTFIDGRMTAWSKDGNFFTEDYIKVSKDPKSNSGLLENILFDYNITWMLDKPDNKLIKYLLENGSQNSKWETAYEDEASTIIRKKSF